MTLKHVIEALLFASQKPLTPKDVVAALKATAEYSEDPVVTELAKTKAAEAGEVFKELQAEYETLGRAFRLVENVSGWQLVSDPECSAWVRMLFPEARPARLSGPALETLAIIAYRQPITRADIEAVRGVAVDGVMQTLLDRGLVKIAGRAEIPGRPLLYETSQQFMEHFGLKSLDELPNASELRKIELPTAPVPEAEPEKPAQMELAESPATQTETPAAAPEEQGAEAQADQESGEPAEPAASEESGENKDA